MRTTRIVGGAAALLVTAGAVVAAVGGDGTSPRVAATGQMPATTIPAIVSGVLSADAAQFSSASGASSGVSADAKAVAGPTPAGHGSVAPAQARVVKTATLDVSVRRDAVAKVADAVGHVAAGQGGYVAEVERNSGAAKSATLTVRVPATAYDATLRELRRLGKVTGESLGGHDVTGTIVDLDARLRSLRVQEQALNALMTKANTVGETLQVAQTVGEVRTQIEQLAAQQAQLVDQADFATITVNVLGPHAAIDSTPSTQPLLVKSFKRASAGALAVLGGVIVVVGYALPTGSLAALVYGLWRLASRRRTTSVPSAA